MAPFVRKELIERADELVRFARTVLDDKRFELLMRASGLYREATLGMMADIIESEAEEWKARSDGLWRG